MSDRVPQEILCVGVKRICIHINSEGVIELLSHRDDRTSRIVSTFVVGDSDDEAKAQGKKHLRSCVGAASGERTPEAAVLH